MSLSKGAKPRWMSADEAMQLVQPGHRVYLHGGAATPHLLVDALVAQAERLTNVELVHLHTEGPAPYVEPEMAGHFRHNALFIGPNVRNAIAEGRADYTPVFLSEIPQLFAQGGPLPIDVALIQVSPPDGYGYSLGVSVDCAHAAVESARIVIAQVNQRMPRSRGSRIPLDAIHALVDGTAPLPQAPQPELSPESLEIGRHVAALVQDGATLQLGIGAIPSAVLSQMTNHRHLGVHSEMFTDALIPLIESGVVDGSRKTLDPGVVVSAFVLGTDHLYDYLDDNPAIELRPVTYTNDVAVITQQDNMVAVNSALSIDLTGQVVADSIGRRFYSGIGGQVDFIRGAARSKGGVPIIAMPSTAVGGTITRIVPDLDVGAGVVTTRGDVHWVVTEYGARNLFGRTIHDRARMLIEIAHPAFRESLAQSMSERLHLR